MAAVVLGLEGSDDNSHCLITCLCAVHTLSPSCGLVHFIPFRDPGKSRYSMVPHSPSEEMKAKRGYKAAQLTGGRARIHSLTPDAV